MTWINPANGRTEKIRMAQFSTAVQGETWYRCPHCKKVFEFYQALYNFKIIDRNKRIFICPRCKEKFGVF